MISIVIPVYNESESLPELYDRLTKVMVSLEDDYEVIFVDDGSHDGSSEYLDRTSAEDAKIKVIRFTRNFGQTAAMAAGFQHASGDIIVALDADLQNDPADIPMLLDELEKDYDVVSGWRKNRRDTLFSRTLPSRLANWLISKVSGIRLHDIGCSLKAYRKSSIEGIRLYGEMHRFIPIYAAWQGGRVSEIPVNHHPRKQGVSKYGLSRIPRVLLDLIVIWFLDKALDRPIQFFGKAGLYSLSLAFCVFLWALYLKLFEDVSFILTPLPMLVVLFSITGLLCILLGLVSEIQMRSYFESQGKNTYKIKTKINL
ncbi:MAG: glycosyltransferase family 2 protein [Rhodospirillales bacterium]